MTSTVTDRFGNTFSTTDLILRDFHTATAGQTLFNLNISYPAGENVLAVYVNGLRMVVGTDFTETSVSSITFAVGLAAGDQVEIFAGMDIGTALAWANAANFNYLAGGTGAVLRSVQAKLREGVSVTDFGADPTGVADSTAAIKAALNYAFSGGDPTINITLEFPVGTYLITTNNAFGQWTPGTYHKNVKFKGSGRDSSRIIFRPGGSTDRFLYDGETDGGGAGRAQQLLFVLFEDLGFECSTTGMSAGRCNLFKQFPLVGSPNQNFQFQNCNFYGPATEPRAGSVMTISGTVNGSENTFINCRAQFMRSIMRVTNPQSVNHTVLACDWENMHGDIYNFSGGGGNLQHVGGSVIYNTLTAESFLLNADATGGSIAGAFNFIGIKTEGNNVLAKILNVAGANNAALYNFLVCDFSSLAGTGARTSVSVLPDCPATVLFDHCDMQADSGGPHNYEFKAALAANYWASRAFNASIEFRDCRIPTDIHDQLSWGANAQGLMRIRGGHGAATWNGTDPQMIVDADLLGTLGMSRPPMANAPQAKTAIGQIYYWPDTTLNTSGGSARVKLPAGSVIKSIRVRKIAYGGSGASYRLAVTNDDGTFTYGFTTTAAQNAQHDFADPAVWRLAVSGVNQIIRVVAIKELAYNTQTGNFTVGQTITDATTATTAKILADADAGATGTLTLGFITGGTGAFGVGNIISDPLGGSATAGATTDRQGGTVAQTMAAGDIYAIEYL